MKYRGSSIAIFSNFWFLCCLIKGVATQKCSCESSEWEGKPNTENCTHKWVSVLNQLIDGDRPAEHISQKWAQFLQSSTKKMFLSFIFGLLS